MRDVQRKKKKGVKSPISHVISYVTCPLVREQTRMIGFSLGLSSPWGVVGKVWSLDQVIWSDQVILNVPFNCSFGPKGLHSKTFLQLWLLASAWVVRRWQWFL